MLNRVDQYIDENNNVVNVNYDNNEAWWIDKSTGERLSRPLNNDELMMKEYYLAEVKKETAQAELQQLLDSHDADRTRLLAIANDDRLTQSDRDIAGYLVRLNAALPAMRQQN